MKNISNLHIMQDAEERRSIITTYYKEGKRRGIRYGFLFGFISGFFFYLILLGLMK